LYILVIYFKIKKLILKTFFSVKKMSEFEKYINFLDSMFLKGGCYDDLPKHLFIGVARDIDKGIAFNEHKYMYWYWYWLNN